ncbi:MAG TPA: sodium/glutamate symporter [Bryobacteraceae bacterium]|nr:sodium/glutamate symporter [Bryobacteraceae bacterium]
MLSWNAPETLALAAGGLWLAGAVHGRARFLDRWNIPRPVTGGLLLAGGVAAARGTGYPMEFDTSLRDLFTLVFFTTVGLRASAGLLRREGGMVLVCLALAVAGAELQNAVGITGAKLLGLNPLLGIIAGATTLAGGPATALAFGKTFEELGVADAQTVGVASAVFGILAAGLISGAVGGWLIRRHGLVGRGSVLPSVADRQRGEWLLTLGAIAGAMGLGSLVSRGIAAGGVTLPGYIGAMIVAAVVRWADDAGARRLDEGVLERAGNLSLGLFIGMALLTLKLWVLASLALPLLLLLSIQTVVTTLFAVFVAYRWLGRDYEGAVAAAGWTGFMLGTTANAVACMDVLEARYGAAPRSRLAVPVVGAFLVDFTNSFVILSGADFVRRVLL